MYVPFEITDSGKFSFLAYEKASSGLNLFFPDIWSTLSSNFLIVLFCFSHWSRSFASSCEDKTDSSEILGIFSPSGSIAFTPCFATWSTFRRSHYFSLSHSLLFLYIYSNQMYSGMGEPFPPSSSHSPDLTRHLHKPRWRLYGRTWPVIQIAWLNSNFLYILTTNKMLETNTTYLYRYDVMFRFEGH